MGCREEIWRGLRTRLGFGILRSYSWGWLGWCCHRKRPVWQSEADSCPLDSLQQQLVGQDGAIKSPHSRSCYGIHGWAAGSGGTRICTASLSTCCRTRRTRPGSKQDHGKDVCDHLDWVTTGRRPGSRCSSRQVNTRPSTSHRPLDPFIVTSLLLTSLRLEFLSWARLRARPQKFLRDISDEKYVIAK